jgi:uncharacterized membrane protein
MRIERINMLKWFAAITAILPLFGYLPGMSIFVSMASWHPRFSLIYIGITIVAYNLSDRSTRKGWLLLLIPLALIPLIFYSAIFLIWNTKGFSP